MACFKSPDHTHDSVNDANASENLDPQITETTSQGSKFDKVLNDAQIQSMLKYKSLQFHLSVILKILHDMSITGESVSDNRKEIANLKLTNLRSGGLEENELVEDFVGRVLFLLNEK